MSWRTFLSGLVLLGLFVPADPAVGRSTEPARRSEEALTRAQVLLEENHAGEAQALLEETIEELRALPRGDSSTARDLDLARALDLLVKARSSQGSTSGSWEELLQEALHLREEALGSSDPLVAETLGALGYWANQVADYGSARPYLERSIATYEKGADPPDPRLAESLTNLSYTHWATGDLEEARSLLLRAIEVQEQVLAPNDPALAVTLTNLGYLYQVAGEHEKARPLLEDALTTLEKSLGPRHPRVADTLNNLATLSLDTGDPGRAWGLYSRALSIRQEHLPLSHPLVAQSFAYLSSAHLALGQPKAALPLIERALHIQQRALGPNHPAVTQLWVVAAQNRLALGRSGPALEAALIANDQHNHQVSLTVQAFPEWHSVLRSGLDTQGLDLALSIALEVDDPAVMRKVWNALIPSRALILDEIAERRRILRRTLSPGLDDLWRDLDEARRELASLSLQGPQERSAAEYEEELEAAQRSKDQAEMRLARRSATFRQERRFETVLLADVQEALPAGAALVSYVLYHRIPLDQPLPRRVSGAQSPSAEARYAAFVLPPSSGELRLLDLGSAREINGLVDGWRERITGYSEDLYQSAARLLRLTLWDPVEEHLGAAPRVFVVPAGEIHRVSLPSLARDDGRYLLEEGPLIHLLSTERELLLGLREKPTGRGLLALGGPDFDASPDPEGARNRHRSPAATALRGAHSSCDLFRTFRFLPLPGAEAEAEEILNLWRQEPTGPGESLVRTEASETALREKAPGRRMLHLATHGFLLGEECPSFLAPPQAGSRSQVEDPLLLAGLALAGANHRQHASPGEDDGILTAEEIASLDLTGVEWVVLSGCDTGVGPVAGGEGVLGLRRAFRVAGAGSLILSLWKVEDQATREWMHELYRSRLEEGMDTAESVRAASVAVLRQRRKDGRSTHPFYWAAFVAEGDWR